jgi:hypothetical protein
LNRVGGYDAPVITVPWSLGEDVQLTPESAMPVTYGYLKNTNDASIGAVMPVPHLKEIGVTCTNDHFVVFGTKAEVRECGARDVAGS